MYNDDNTKITEDFIALLEKDEQYAWFQQDGATAHVAENTVDILDKFFEDRIISEGRWPTRRPDLTPPDFFLWHILKIMFIGLKEARLTN